MCFSQNQTETESLAIAVVKLVKGLSLSEKQTFSLVPVARRNSSH